jgi:hypothetical protein
MVESVDDEKVCDQLNIFLLVYSAIAPDFSK